MPPEIVDLNDYQVPEWPTTPEGEARQADEVERHYRTLVGHPAVAAITCWGLPDGGWLNAPGGLVRATARQARVRRAARADQGRVVAGADDAADRLGRPRPVQRVPGTYEVAASGRTAVVVLDGSGELAITATLSATTAPGPSH